MAKRKQNPESAAAWRLNGCIGQAKFIEESAWSIARAEPPSETSKIIARDIRGLARRLAESLRADQTSRRNGIDNSETI